ncbi:hypothetical protein KP509_18G005800 [Ceratopteris richardii]|uniref:SAWADEE domain-containing protein n=1 Tax=Ceratopteris richardii TaxID=49495 RepID=A0A8T2SQV2_CERRI|nr:hypothetical protein KP509_18G005800 [Ceratopteris richardii]
MSTNENVVHQPTQAIAPNVVPAKKAREKKDSGPADAGRPSVPMFRFLPHEVSEMEKLWEERQGSFLREDVRNLVQKFRNAPERTGRPVHDRQIQNWFWNKRCTLKKQAWRSATEGAHLRRTEEQPVGATPDDKNVEKLEFEAKSSRDSAWYDVKLFLAHRMLDSGDPEVRVRYVGFGADDDEWVNVRTGVRLRSLPCEASECVSVLPGDLILCFKEGSRQALYYDAIVKEVNRRRHDIRGCRCRFLVQYEHDGSMDTVPLRKVCRRPETEYRRPAPENTDDVSCINVKSEPVTDAQTSKETIENEMTSLPS